jgi:hypothetical protein
MAVIKRQKPPPTAPPPGATPGAPAPGGNTSTETTGDPVARSLLALAVVGRALAKSIDGLAEAIRGREKGVSHDQ